MKITPELIAELRERTKTVPQEDGDRLYGFLVSNDRFEHVAGLFMLRDLLDAAEQAVWRPIETLGFGVEQHIVIASEYGFAWVVECDKDMDGEWLKRSYAKDVEHTGPVTHWRLLDLPQPNGSASAPSEENT